MNSFAHRILCTCVLCAVKGCTKHAQAKMHTTDHKDRNEIFYLVYWSLLGNWKHTLAQLGKYSHWNKYSHFKSSYFVWHYSSSLFRRCVPEWAGFMSTKNCLSHSFGCYISNRVWQTRCILRVIGPPVYSQAHLQWPQLKRRPSYKEQTWHDRRSMH